MLLVVLTSGVLMFLTVLLRLAFAAQSFAASQNDSILADLYSRLTTYLRG